MLRKLQHIPLADLKVSKLNVRKHGARDIDSLAASIAAIGILQPLLVRKNCEGFDIVAGQRRYLAARKLAVAAHPHADPLPCMLLAADDDAAAIEASLAENIERLPMDEMDQFEAFARLRDKGLSEADIAVRFAISEAIVQRRLALAKLDPGIRRLYRAGEIDAATLRLLTLATRERQKAWLALTADAEQEPPPQWQLKAWLLGGAEIATSAALFDEASYGGAIVADLFGEERYFADPDAFWRLQNAAIADTRDKLLAAGWAHVEVLEPGTRLDTWDYEGTTKVDGGGVYIEVEADGHVTIRKGLRPKRKAQRRSGGSDGESGRAGAVADRPEMTQALASYVDLVRHSTVRLAVARSPKVALRLLLAHAIGGGRWWKVEPEQQSPHSPAIGAAIAALPTEAEFQALRSEAASPLGHDDEGPVVGYTAAGERTAAVFAALLDMPDKDVNRLLGVVMAETLAAGTGLIDTLGALLGVDVASQWQPDDAYFDLLRDRECLGAMLAEVIGKRAADSYLTDTASRKKDIIRKALAGEGRSKVSGWLPRHMAFPQGRYTERPLRGDEPPAA